MTQDILSRIKNYAKAYEQVLLIHESEHTLTFFCNGKTQTITRDSINDVCFEQHLLAKIIREALKGDHIRYDDGL